MSAKAEAEVEAEAEAEVEGIQCFPLAVSLLPLSVSKIAKNVDLHQNATILKGGLMEPYFHDKCSAIYLGDCRRVMKEFEENSVDAIVTDPPYHLTTGKKGGTGEASVNLGTPQGRARVTTGFMGMTWDGGDIAHSVELWRECLRVLKPGGHLLSFGGSRTYHRMACAIEYAGFEIRDQIMWIYSQGFPKSLNLDKMRGSIYCGCTGDALPYVHDETQPQTECGLHSMRSENVPTPFDFTERGGEVLQSPLPEQGSSTSRREQFPAAQVRPIKSVLEGRSYTSEAARELCLGSVCALPGMGVADGSQGRLRDGASSRDGRMDQTPLNEDGSGPPQESSSIGERSNQSRTLARQPEPQISGAWPLCHRCGKPMVAKGLGTALKPAHEPICVARKPLIGTVAANVQKWGTGALNIDGCRVEGPMDGVWGSSNKTVNPKRTFVGSPDAAEYRTEPHPEGRWPANVIYDGSEEVVSRFQHTSSGANTVKRTSSKDGQGNTGAAYGAESRGDGTEMIFYGDNGSAARFFYTAKADRQDRNEGCEGLDKKPLLWSSGTKSPGTFQAEGTDRAAKNNHPTVKPTDLMRYLCRLVTQPGGVVLDPFMGSGSTRKAALEENLRFIGIEIEEKYCAIAVLRTPQSVLDFTQESDPCSSQP